MSYHSSPCRSLNYDKPPCYRLTVLGGGRVGKTALLRRFLQDEFVEKYRETVEDLHIREFYVNNSLIQAHIFDTAGNMQFPAMRRLSIGNAQALLLVYDVSSLESFRLLEEILHEIKDVRTEKEIRDLPIVIAANKCDHPQEDWAVTSQMIDKFMLNETMDTRAVHMETSAKTGYNVRAVFETFIKISPLFLNQSITRHPDPAPAALNTSFDFVGSNTLNGVGQWGITRDRTFDRVAMAGSPVHQPGKKRAQRRFSLQTLSHSVSSPFGQMGASNYSVSSQKAERGSNPSSPTLEQPQQPESSPRRYRPQANSFGAGATMHLNGKARNSKANGLGVTTDELSELRRRTADGNRRTNFFKRSKTKSHDEGETPDCYVQ